MTELKFNPSETLPLLPSSPQDGEVLAQVESLSQQGKLQEAVDALAPHSCTSMAAKALARKLESQLQKQNACNGLNLIAAFFPQNAKCETSEILQRLATSLQDNKNLRVAFAALTGKDQDEIRSKLGKQRLSEIFCISENQRTEQFFEDAIHFGVRLKQNDELDAAGGVLSFIANAKDLVSAELGKNAELELNAMLGKGETGRRFEFLVGRFSKEVSDYKTIVPMIGASIVGQLVSTAALGRFASMPQGLLTRGVGARWIAGSLGFFAEASTFAVSGRIVSDSPAGPLHEDFERAFLTIGALRLCSFLGNQAFLKVHGFNELGIPTQLTSLARFNQIFIPQAAMFTGMMASHKIEEALKLRPHVDGATAVMDTLASMLSMEVGSHFGHSALGERFARLQKEMGVRADIFTTSDIKRETIKKPAQESSSTVQNVLRSFALNNPLTWMLMGVEGGGGGGKFGKEKGKKDLSKALELASSENPLALERLVQEAKKNNSEALTYLEYLAEDSHAGAMLAISSLAGENHDAAFSLLAFGYRNQELALALIPHIQIEALVEQSRNASDEGSRVKAMMAVIHLSSFGNEAAKEAAARFDLQVLAGQAFEDQVKVLQMGMKFLEHGLDVIAGEGGGANQLLKAEEFRFATTALGILLRQRTPEALRTLIELTEKGNVLAFNSLAKCLKDADLSAWIMPELLASARRSAKTTWELVLFAKINSDASIRIRNALQTLDLSLLPHWVEEGLEMSAILLLSLSNLGHLGAKLAGKRLRVEALGEKASQKISTVSLLLRMVEELRNPAAKETLRTLEVSHYSDQARTDEETVLVLANLADLNNRQAELALKKLDISHFVKEAEGLARSDVNQELVEDLEDVFYELSKIGNIKARQALIKLANLNPRMFGEALRDFGELEALESHSKSGEEQKMDANLAAIVPGETKTFSAEEFDEKFSFLPAYHGEPITWIKEYDQKISEIASYGKVKFQGKSKTLYLQTSRFETPEGHAHYLMVGSDSPNPLNPGVFQRGRNLWLKTEDGDLVKEIHRAVFQGFKNGMSPGEAIRWLKDESPWAGSEVLKTSGAKSPFSTANLVATDAVNPDNEQFLPMLHPLEQEKVQRLEEIQSLNRQFQQVLSKMAEWGFGAPADIDPVFKEFLLDRMQDLTPEDREAFLGRMNEDEADGETLGAKKFRLLEAINAKYERLKEVDEEIQKKLKNAAKASDVGENTELEDSDPTIKFFAAKDSEGLRYFLRPYAEGELIVSNHGGPWVVEKVEGKNHTLRHETECKIRVLKVESKGFQLGDRVILTPSVEGGSGDYQGPPGGALHSLILGPLALLGVNSALLDFNSFFGEMNLGTQVFAVGAALACGFAAYKGVLALRNKIRNEKKEAERKELLETQRNIVETIRQTPPSFSSFPPDPAWKTFTGSAHAIPPEKREKTTYHPNGSIRLVKLVSLHVTEKILFPRGTTLRFDETGRLQWAILGRACNIAGVRYPQDGYVQFENGRVVSTTPTKGGNQGE